VWFTKNDIGEAANHNTTRQSNDDPTKIGNNHHIGSCCKALAQILSHIENHKEEDNNEKREVEPEGFVPFNFPFLL
jgi:hypothetical protein